MDSSYSWHICLPVSTGAFFFPKKSILRDSEEMRNKIGQTQKGEASRRHISSMLALPLLTSKGEETGGPNKRNSSHPHLRF